LVSAIYILREEGKIIKIEREVKKKKPWIYWVGSMMT